MGNLELIEALENTYPDTLDGIKTQEQLIRAKAYRDVVNFVKLQLDPQPKKRNK